MPSSVKSNPTVKKSSPALQRGSSQSTSNLYNRPQAKPSSSQHASSKPSSTSLSKLPSHLIPVATKYYNMSSLISETFRRICHYKAIYFLWLDCLYETKVTFEQVVAPLKPLIDAKALRGIRKEGVYVFGDEINDKLVPAGSCVLFVDKEPRMNSLIREHRIRMMLMDKHWALRLPTTTMFVFGDGFKNFFKDLDPVCLEHAFSTPTGVIGSDQSGRKSVSSPSSDSMNIMIKKLTCRFEATLIVESYDVGDIFIRFEYQGSKPLEYKLLIKCLPELNFTHKNIFLIHVKDYAKVAKGVIAINRNSDTKEFNLNDDEPLKVDINGAILSFINGSYQAFRSNIMNIHQCHILGSPTVSDKTSDSLSSLSQKTPPHEIIELEVDEDDSEDIINPPQHLFQSVESKPIVRKQTLAHQDVETEFVPITKETLKYAQRYIEKYRQENRLIVSIHDECVGPCAVLTFENIRKRLESLFASIELSGCFVLTEAKGLEENLVSAYKKEFKLVGTCFIVCRRETKIESIIERSKEMKIHCGQYSINSVERRILQGEVMMSKTALQRAGAPLQHLTCCLRSPVITKAPQQTKTKVAPSLPTEPSTSGQRSGQRKGSRIAATLGGFLTSQLDQMESKLSDRAEKDMIVGETLDKLRSFGNTIIQIYHLPNQLTLNAFRVMFNLPSIHHNQLIAVDEKLANKTVMTISLMLPADSRDVSRLLEKDGFKTALNTVLNIKKIDLKALEQFLSINVQKLRTFSEEDLIPREPKNYALKHTQV